MTTQRPQITIKKPRFFAVEIANPLVKTPLSPQNKKSG
jgi:hypothetical protein